MSELIMCDRCGNTYYTDSRTDKGAYCELRIIYNGNSKFHLCKKCFKEFNVEFMKMGSDSEFYEEFGFDFPMPIKRLKIRGNEDGDVD